MRDEAADTPLWMPLVGLCLLLLGAFAVIWQAANRDEEGAAPEAAEAAAAPAADEAPAEPTPEGEAPEAAPE